MADIVVAIVPLLLAPPMPPAMSDFLPSAMLPIDSIINLLSSIFYIFITSIAPYYSINSSAFI